MCGIVGFTGKPDTEKLQTMLRFIQHRGPDDDATCELENFQLGMRRLAIIDLTDDLYPITNETGEILCVFNGEIYNYQDLTAELKAKGHQFKTKSDTETIVHGYEEWGIDFVQKLRGMFVIVLYDKREKKLFLIRDRLGIKPLYYTEVEDRIVWASELKAILGAWDIDRSADNVSVLRFLMSRVHDDTDRTFFANIKRVLPGHYMQVDATGKKEIIRYWELKTNPDFKSAKPDKEYAAEFREQFTESMRLHLISDVPLGFTLSGGLDSSSVTSVAKGLIQQGSDTHTHNKLLTFSALHPGETIDESEYINEVVKHTGATAYSVVPNVDEFWREINTWMYYQEEPTISTAPYAYYTVMRKAKEHVKVLLSGQGGDELMAGYIPYFMSYIQSAQDAGAWWEIMRECIQGFDLYAPFVGQKLQAKFTAQPQINPLSALRVDNQAKETMRLISHRHERNLNKRLLFDITAGSVPNLLRYEDKNSMAHSIESRVPFLDHVFVEFVHTLPIDQKIKYGWNRHVYRLAMQGLIPEKNRTRRSKIGFVNSEWEWLQEKHVEIKAIFASAEFGSRSFWHADKVLDQFTQWVDGKIGGDGLFFWRVLSTELWMRIYVDKQVQLIS